MIHVFSTRLRVALAAGLLAITACGQADEMTAGRPPADVTATTVEASNRGVSNSGEPMPTAVKGGEVTTTTIAGELPKALPRHNSEHDTVDPAERAVPRPFELVSSVPPDPKAPGFGSRLLDASLKWWDGSPVANEVQYSTVQDLMAASKVGFVGRVVGVEPDVFREDLSPQPYTSVHDGIQFEVDEVLFGDVRPAALVTLDVPSVVISKSGTIERYMSDYPAMLEPGLRDPSRTQRYLVFASPAQVGGVTLYYAQTKAGLALVDGEAITAAFPGSPLAQQPWSIRRLRSTACADPSLTQAVGLTC